MSDSKELRTMRMMAWERAKGELHALRNTYWTDHENYAQFSVELEKFVAEVESHGLQE